jgi:two-component system chemotaxis response regulator CheB
MGEDGAAGLGRLRDKGGNTMVQDAETSVVFGMPGTALRLGAASLSLPPHRLAKALVAMAATSGPRGRR